MRDRRPDPQRLLSAIEKANANSAQGQLRLFLGMCPGVGKTYAMLEAARLQQARGVTVLVGLVETHGRRETQNLLDGLKILPRQKIDYRGTSLEEMDIDAILSAKPQLVLVDELAHTNAPGARHRKRYQDVEELLAAGIDVYTTVNIQHIESRNDQVAQITGIKVKETVPDSIIERADQVEIIDIPPEELLHRLREGKVYLGERAERAKENFFQEEYLTALRELALRFVAERVDQDLNSQMAIKGIEGPWNTNERLLVAVSHSPYSSRLIRTTKRMAYNLEAPWVALYVDTGQLLSLEDEKVLHQNLALARELGAEVITVADHEVAHAIHTICGERNVTQIIMGRPDRRFIKDFIYGGTLLDQLVRTTSKIDVHVIRAERTPRFRGFHLKWPSFRSHWLAYYNTTWFLIGVSFLSYAVLPYAGYRALGSVFLLAILGVACFASRGPILYSALVCAIVWNFFFIPPTFTFNISTSDDVMMVLSFFVTAVVGGFLTTRIRQQQSTLENREYRTRLLYELVQRLADAKDTNWIQSVLQSVVEQQFGGENAVYFSEKDGKVSWTKGVGKVLTEKELAVAQWAFENNKPAGWSTPTLSAAECLCLPLRSNKGVVGILAYFPADRSKSFSIEQENFLETVLIQVAIAFERFQFSEAAQKERLYEASEVLHQTLLNSVSHELRTPITAIVGSATALRDPATFSDEKARGALTEELVHSAQRLDRVVENLLDLSRLQKGTLQLKAEWFDLGDVFRAVKSDLQNETGGRSISLVRDDVVLFEGDFQLLSHGLNQLVLNALKYSEGNSTIEVEIIREASRARILVRDQGKGIPSGLEKQIFEKFYRVPGTPAGGLGLGLTIVNNIVQLHGGSVGAKKRADGPGSVFEIILPLKPPPEALTEALK